MLRRSLLVITALALCGAAIAQAQQPPAPGEYWLGLMCVPADPALRAQLNLPENQGMLVVQVLPESPAAKAGIAQHDILLSFGGQPLGALDDLLKAVEDAKDAAKPVELIRGGKRQTIEVAPAKRPEQQRQLRAPGTPPSDDDWALVQRWLEGMKPDADGPAMRPPVRFRFFHPGTILSGDATAAWKPMPANLTVRISKSGDEPASIEVQRGEESWNLTEDELEKLPEDVRPFVERMLGRGMKWLGRPAAFDAVPDVMMPAMPGGPGAAGGMAAPRPPQAGGMEIPPMPGIDPRVEQRLNELDRRMDRMLKLMEKFFEDQSEEPEKAEE